MCISQTQITTSDSVFNAHAHGTHFQLNRDDKHLQDRKKNIHIFSMSVVVDAFFWVSCFFFTDFSIEFYTKCSHKHVLLHTVGCT